MSAVVSKFNARRSVDTSLFREERGLVPCGNVSIPVNHETPPVGDIVEVRYLNPYRDSLAPYQLVYLKTVTSPAKSAQKL